MICVRDIAHDESQPRQSTYWYSNVYFLAFFNFLMPLFSCCFLNTFVVQLSKQNYTPHTEQDGYEFSLNSS